MLKFHNEEVCKNCNEPPKSHKACQKEEKKKRQGSNFGESSESLRQALGQLEDEFRNLKKYKLLTQVIIIIMWLSTNVSQSQ
jgi:hypothetical protein